jgi:diketogulonate reductase-like aldo/keto reductase
VWNSEQGYDNTLQACERSLRRLGLAYVDLYLIHWPVRGKSIETWKALIKILQQSRDLEEILQYSKDIPAVNQVEFHPFLYQNELLRFCKNNNIQLEAYSPLTRAKRLNHPTIIKIAKKYSKTPAQVLIRWNLQHDVVVIPKSIHEDRIRENSQVFDFRIEPDDMKLLDSLNENLQTVFLD